VKLKREAGESIQEIEEEIYKRTSVSSTRLKEKNKDEGGCIRLYNRSDVVYGM